jgi:hypothetical protein
MSPGTSVLTCGRAIACLFACAVAVAPAVAQAQSRVAVPADQLTKLRTRSATLQRIGPAGVDTIRGDVSVALSPGEILVATDEGRGTAPLAADSSAGAGWHWDVPLSLIVPTDAGARTLRVTVQTGAGLVYSRTDGTFTGDVLIGLEDEESPFATVTLNTPVVVQTISLAGEVSPEIVRLAHTQVPLQRLRVTSRSPGDSVPLRILYAQQAPMDIHVPVRRTPLVVAPERVRINGFGLEKARFSVMLPSELETDSVQIGFSSVLQPEARSAYAGRGSPAVTTIQSRGVGRDTLRVVGPHYVIGTQAVIYYAPPWLFLLAAILGGIVGTLVRDIPRKSHPPDRPMDRGRIARNIVAGVLAGLLVAVAYAIGVNLLPISVTGPPVEAVIFVVSGIGAFLGGASLRKVLGRV